MSEIRPRTSRILTAADISLPELILTSKKREENQNQDFVTESDVDLVVKSSELVPPTEHILADSDIENSEPNKERDNIYKPETDSDSGASKDHTNHNLTRKETRKPTVTDIRDLQYGKEGIMYKIRHTEEWQPLPFIRVPRDMPIWKYNEHPMMYSTRIPIKAEKYQHLMALKTSIEKYYHPFYDALTHL
ncbi:unnamed protein product [Psylliodes chrysocephalus]|uniref:Uncharacterized protein n=1 Tax=Psylliodes chrysocephalus TaxID=3402493 RepID=A0A9P0GLM0_9CUCU|nr:unnamed protein product [Psylliodes chrysocephala]